METMLHTTPGRALARHRSELIALLARHGMTNPRVFGSVARREDVPGSDLDVLVDVTPQIDLLDLIDAAEEAEALLEVPVELVASRALRPGHEILRTAVAL
ncbi:nucleotidyltransferase family protein [Kytococcus aerolatus]|nr:nucleotidyltransferase domain-containing protein [Kytococcus aerolatus]